MQRTTLRTSVAAFSPTKHLLVPTHPTMALTSLTGFGLKKETLSRRIFGGFCSQANLGTFGAGF